MKKTSVFILLFSLILTVACKKEKKQVIEPEATTTEDIKVETKPTDVKKIKVVLTSASGSSVKGHAVFKETNGAVSMTTLLEGLSEGEHAIHIHEKSDCSSPDGKSAGGHWNPTGQPHGKWGAPEGFHKGDIGNFKADANGNGSITLTTDEWCIGCGDNSKDIIGKAIIVHEGTDDFVSQPSGAAGSRISCGGIIQ